jgi:DNA-binding beta-propeller fold protein YncE
MAAVAVIAVVAVVAVITAGISIRAPGHSPRPSAARQPPATVYVYTPAGTVTAIDPGTNTHGKPVKVRGGLGAIAIAPDGQTAYVASYHAGIRSGTVTPTGKYDMCQSMPQRPKETPRAC